MSEDLKFPNAVAVNRNLIAQLIDALVEAGSLSPEVRDRIIDDTLATITPYPNELIMSTADEFVDDIFVKMKEKGMLEASASPPAPPVPPAKPVCPSCGFDITPGHKFCVECGSTLG